MLIGARNTYRQLPYHNAGCILLQKLAVLKEGPFESAGGNVPSFSCSCRRIRCACACGRANTEIPSKLVRFAPLEWSLLGAVLHTRPSQTRRLEACRCGDNEPRFGLGAAPHQLTQRLTISTYCISVSVGDHRIALIGLRVRVERRTGWGFAGENKFTIMARGPLGGTSSIVGSATCSSCSQEPWLCQ